MISWYLDTFMLAVRLLYAYVSIMAFLAITLAGVGAVSVAGLLLYVYLRGREK